MTAGREPYPNGQHPPRRPRRRRAVWLLAAGVILGLAAVICEALNVISVQQATALGLPAVLLIIAGLITTLALDADTGQRRAFLAGFRAGALLAGCEAPAVERATGVSRVAPDDPGNYVRQPPGWKCGSVTGGGSSIPATTSGARDAS